MPTSIRPLALLLIAILLSLFAASSQAAENQLTEKEVADGWILLFDGESLFGWHAASKADWKADGGVIRVTSGEPGLLHTGAQFADYELKADFRSPKATNSGIFLRTQPTPKNPKEGCYELNIAPFGSSPYATGSLVARGETAKAPEGFDGDGEHWHTFDVRCEGPNITVSIDGKQVVNYKETIDSHPTRRGHIGLQLNSGEVSFRNIKLKPLGQKPLFNGKDLTGWHPHPDLKESFSVDGDGLLQLAGGKSQLESETKFGDFSLQLAARANKPRSNSGVFFRSIPSEVMNGYECQLQNVYGADGKPNPVDCGTGGICRRQVARKLVAKDGDWLHLTLIATGPHMASWVNGYQVTDFTDTRKPHSNPRNGLRTEAGTLILQGHDESTEFSFKSINAVELPK